MLEILQIDRISSAGLNLVARCLWNIHNHIIVEAVNMSRGVLLQNQDYILEYTLILT